MSSSQVESLEWVKKVRALPRREVSVEFNRVASQFIDSDKQLYGSILSVNQKYTAVKENKEMSRKLDDQLNRCLDTLQWIDT